jgi:chemotaxis protein methyltransferase CheR
MLTSREQIFEISKLLTVNETYFFREGAHFNLLVRHFLPQLTKLNRPIRICSAATSIGCEAYSIAMLLDYYANKGPCFDFEIDAFDINAEAIETANKARYTANTLRSDGSDWRYILDLYLAQEGDEYVVSQNIRRKVSFFTHNIMRGLNKQYDVIFFRNALIYFSSKNRLIVMNDMADSLSDNGLLFLGISETSSVRHPMLANQYLSDVFYFQKTGAMSYKDLSQQKHTAHRQDNAAAVKNKYQNKIDKHDTAGVENKVHSDREKSVHPRPIELPVDCGEVKAILQAEEGQPNAEKILEIIGNGKNTGAYESDDSLSGAALAASAVYFLNVQDFNSADKVLSFLEKRNTGAIIRFLRGEYFLLNGRVKEAEHFFTEATVKDMTFWPAFYRMTSLTAEGNRTRHEYRIKKACESLELGKDLQYECFMGGFSPDYFFRILEKKLI